LLFDVAALLLTSVTAGPVAEAFSVPQHPISAVSQPYIGPEPGLGPDIQIGTGSLLLDQLAFLPVGDIEEFVGDHPAALADLLTNPPAAQDVNLWWSALSVEARSELTAADPALVGNLNGLPFGARDGANRLLLDSTLAELRVTAASDAGRAVVEDAGRRILMLEAIEDALTASDGTPHGLLSLDVTGEGRAAVVVGDLVTADYVTYLVPGMFFTIEGQMADWTDIAAQLYQDEQQWIERTGGSGTVATVAWIGYHTPNLTNVGSIDRAQEGSVALAGAIEGLQSQRAGDEPYITVVAHSYGATAALLALADTPVQVDALAMLGSPGSPAQSVADLHVTDGNVWVGEAAWDPVPNSSFFGSDPGSAAYGAHLMSVDGGSDAVTGRALSASVGHLGYFAADSEAMRNLALISIARGDLVSR
jgi:hypothetical protein